MTTPTLTTTATLTTTGAFLGHLNTSDCGKVNPEGIEEKSTQYSHLKSWTGMNIFRRKYWLILNRGCRVEDQELPPVRMLFWVSHSSQFRSVP